MATRTFTDDLTGEKFELHGTMPLVNEEIIVIKPIKAVEKHTHELNLLDLNDMRKSVIFTSTLELSAPTAQKVAEAIEALMAYILWPYPINPEYEETDVKFVEADKARAAFQEDE